MDFFAFCGIGIVACVLIITVKQYRPDIAVVLAIAAGIILLAYMASDLGNTIAKLYDLMDGFSAFREEAGMVIRALGICLVSQLTSDICRDAGQATIASRIELGGKIVSLMLVFPIFVRILETAEMIMDG